MKRIVAMGLLVAAVVACGDSTAQTIVFGEGEIPPAIPNDFPLPADAVIGSTLIDTINTKSEFEFRTNTGLQPLVQSLSVGLVNLGYVVDASSGDSFRWEITFRRDGLDGLVALQSLGTEFAQGVVTVNDS